MRSLVGVLLIGASAAFAAGCSGGREARLQEVQRRSRAARETISELEKPFLQDPEPDVRALAVWAIGDARAPEAVEVLSPLAKDPDPWVRLAVVLALCRVGGDDAPEAVVALASDSDTVTRRAAVRCVAARPNPAAGVLPHAVRDTDKEVRMAALDGLVRHPEAGARAALVEAVTTRAPEEQLGAVAALRTLRDPEAIPDLEKAAASRLPPAVRDAVEGAIIELRSALQTQQTEDPPEPPGKDAPSPPHEEKTP